MLGICIASESVTLDTQMKTSATYRNTEAAVEFVRHLNTSGLVDGDGVVLRPVVLPVQGDVWRVNMRICSDCMFVGKEAPPDTGMPRLPVPATILDLPNRQYDGHNVTSINLGRTTQQGTTIIAIRYFHTCKALP